MERGLVAPHQPRLAAMGSHQLSFIHVRPLSGDLLPRAADRALTAHLAHKESPLVSGSLLGRSREGAEQHLA